MDLIYGLNQIFITFSRTDLSLFKQGIQQRTSGPGECCWSYLVSVFEDTSKNLVVQGRVNWSIVVK